MEVALILVVLAVPLWLDTKATRLVVGDEFSERTQKLAQLLLIWLVPLLGALIVLAVHRPAEPPSRQYRTRPEPPDDFGTSGRTMKNLDGDD